MRNPEKLVTGDKIALITPASTASHAQIKLAIERYRALGFVVDDEPHLYQQDGYFSGSTPDNIVTIHQAFSDAAVKAVIAVRGGYGCMRLLPHLDFSLIAANPKIIMGFSDITALLNAISYRAGLVTFHGPTAGKPMAALNQTFFESTLCNAKDVALHNPKAMGQRDVPSLEQKTQCIYPGKVKGRLWGGNLTVFNQLLGTKYLPSSFEDCILFFEDVNEDVYAIDRALCSLELHGILPQIRGCVFGCFKNTRISMAGSFRLEQVLQRYMEKYQIPSFSEGYFGHQEQQYILPVGQEVVMDAETGSITFDSAVTARYSGVVA